MVRSFKKIQRSSVLELDADQIKAAKDLGKEITGVWKADDAYKVIQIDRSETTLYYWDKGAWVEFSPVAITPTDSLAAV